MTKKQKIEYINKINDKFINARNHGTNGSNWWYPKENIIAYNVKVYGCASIEDIRKKMTKRQNEYYSDDNIYDILNERQNNDAEFFCDDVCNDFPVVTAHYAGRSGGWLEVEYQNNIAIDDIEQETNNQYKIAKELDELEQKVSKFIHKAVKQHSSYIETDDYIVDFIEYGDWLCSDDEIADIYKSKAQSLINKLN